MPATLTTYMPGDILFYAKANGDIADTIISQWTDSPLVHVAIAVSASLKIEALFNGVVMTPIDARAVATSYFYTKTLQNLVNANSLAAALLWLHAQVGSMYGWGDIVNATLAKFEQGITVDIQDHFDCSGLATEFLQIAGGIKSLQGVNAHNVTPAGLAKLLGVTN